MSDRMRYLGQGIGLSLLLAAALDSGADETPRPAPRPPARVYTNADLERVHPFSDETGVSSVPAVPASEAASPEREAGPRGQGEAFWRREAAAMRERLRALEERAAALRARIAERAQESPVYGGRRRASSGSSSIASLKASLAAVERRAQKTQDDLEERARRDGALPGWLR